MIDAPRPIRSCRWAELRTASLRLVVVAWIALPLPAMAACDVAKARSAISFATSVEPLLHAVCTECHITGDAPEGLILEGGASYRFLVNVMSREVDMKRVEPGSPESSYLILKLRGTHLEKGGLGDRMPYGRDHLTDEEVAMIAAWITDCSPDN